MNENNPEAESIISSLESEMAVANLEKRGLYAVGIAILAGDILRSALAAGVPYSLAREMATDFWKAEMLADTVAALIREAELGDEDED
ncbi:hypothetical protein HKX69_05665 [Streptomyces argyrophyllae]|uniref:Uncharacterized protein n=1 Tax=Streptomyces argyrophylli TaxID=2726118 RepID=A0A6M4PJF3_9ACTN|nr:hypothetical protein [Streptomyces argyrophyllae]QJS09070.1 hypothetical protein HKX69_05665 [Streptomyces argyrophyllae]